MPGISATVVEAVLVVAGEFGFDVDLKGDGYVVGGEPGQTVVVLDHHDGVGDRDGVFAGLGCAGEVGSVVVKDDAGSAAIAGVTGGGDDDGGIFCEDDLEQGVALGLLAGAVGDELLYGLAWGKPATGGCGIGLKLLQFFGGVAVEERLGDVRGGAHGAEQDDLAGEGSLEFVGAGAGGVDVDDLAGDGAFGGGGPGGSLEPEGFGVGRDHAGPGIDLLPAHAELAPVFEMGVGETDLGEGIAGPGVGLGHVGRAGEARADIVREGSGKLHDVGVAEAFLADAGVHGEVQGLQWRAARRGRAEASCRPCSQTFARRREGRGSRRLRGRRTARRCERRTWGGLLEGEPAE